MPHEQVAVGNYQSESAELRISALGADRSSLMYNDLRYALRILRKNPGFTTVAVLSLALGIGANTAIFTLIDAVLLKMLSVKDPKQLVVFAHRDTGLPSTGSNYPLYRILRDRSQSFSGCFAFWPLEFRARTGAEAEPVRGQYVTPNYFAVLGVQPILGRVFSESDDAEPVAIISHGWWQRRFGSSRDVVGKTMVVNGTPLTVIGVTPPEFFGLQVGNAMEISMPLGIQPRVSPQLGDRREIREGIWGLCIMGRLKPGVELERARSEAEVLVRPWVEEVVLREVGRMGTWARIELLPASTGLDALRRQFSKPLRVLMANCWDGPADCLRECGESPHGQIGGTTERDCASAGHWRRAGSAHPAIPDGKYAVGTGRGLCRPLAGLVVLQ